MKSKHLLSMLLVICMVFSILSPEILVLDEPTSMLDVITQAQMVRLLREYQADHDTAYIFITHNRTLCDSLCSRVYHVEQGIVEEEGVKL